MVFNLIIIEPFLIEFIVDHNVVRLDVAVDDADYHLKSVQRD